MLERESNQIFSEKLRARFIELGLSKQTAAKITKLITPVKLEGYTLVSYCAEPFYRDHIISPKKDEIEKIVQECWGKEYTFKIESPSHEEDVPKIKNSKNPSSDSQITLFPEETNYIPEKKKKLKNKGHFEIPASSKADENPSSEENFQPPVNTEKPRTLDATQNFGTFIRCESNLVAYSACEAVAKNPGNLSNPLFIYGATGLGKTHLLHSVGNEIIQKIPNAKILYITSEDFVNDVIHKGIRVGKMDEVRAKYSACDVLLVDDIQFLEKKDACQIEFFHTFNELYQKRKQIVITSDKFPKDIPNIEERLKSRFLQGLLVDIEPPGFEDRVAIIETKANLIGLKINQEISFLIATHAKTNVREIQGLLKDLLMNQHMTGRSPTIDSVTTILKRRFPTGNMEASIDTTAIQKVVANHFQIKMADLMGPSRQQKFVVARHIAMFLAKEMIGLQIVAIANAFGKKDHTTVLHAMSKVKELLDKDDDFRGSFIQIKRKIEQLMQSN
ncbi:chromosomal replication initiator protein DnaA [Silvanigrella aquatica]|uniref:Chromosomal replication initiator protein DnaA n=1 Tax=Silvanigrella aquatica TaxID=1915309 RepID=A0A1L4CWT6_9BACT|nr:chromosomal replication initiator protein DnaA [Silvanigrella aquatica]APJ02404.1 chromosomal replication initiator protein DnaA [Silvanigrella aquatica]